MDIIGFLKANWGILVPIFISILAMILSCHIYAKQKNKKKAKEEEEFEHESRERLAKLEKGQDMLTTLYPQLKSLEKLENFDKLKLSQEDIRGIVSQVLAGTNISAGAIDAKIEEKVEKKLSDVDKGIAKILARKLGQIDKQLKTLVGKDSDYLMLGNAEHDRKNHSMALEHYNKAIAIRPDYVEAWNNKGVSLYKLDRHDEALKAFDKTTELRPDYAEGWCNKGTVLGRLNRHDEAIEAFGKAIGVEPDYVEAWNNKGVSLYKLGRHDEALKAFDKTTELRPDYAEAWYNKGRLYSLKGDKGNALKSLSTAIGLDAMYEEKAKVGNDFKNLWDDEDFKRLLRETKKILLIEDDEKLIKFIEMKLKESGFEVSLARNGEEGLRKAREEKPDLIVLDLMLPKMDGYKVSRLLKFDVKHFQIPVIMITGRVTERERNLGMEMGADEYITKPFEWEDFLEKVNKHIRLRNVVL